MYPKWQDVPTFSKLFLSQFSIHFYPIYVTHFLTPIYDTLQVSTPTCDTTTTLHFLVSFYCQFRSTFYSHLRFTFYPHFRYSSSPISETLSTPFSDTLSTPSLTSSLGAPKLLSVPVHSPLSCQAALASSMLAIIANNSAAMHKCQRQS